MNCLFWLSVQAGEEMNRQHGWKKWTAYSLAGTEFPRGVTIYGDPGPKRDCSICWREHGDEIQHVGE